MDVNSTLSEINYATYAHNNLGTAAVTTDLPSGSLVVQRYEQIWNVIKTGNVIANITFDLSTIHGVPITAGAPSGYRLLHRTGTSGDFSQLGVSANSVANTDQVTFSNRSLLNGYYTIGTSDIINSPLPIELIRFTAKGINDQQVQLNWQTDTEINNDFFTIERSINGVNWVEIGEIVGAGNSSSLLSYESTDINPSLGVSYYRLKQTDFDGEYSYSHIESVNVKNSRNSNIEIFPNPTINQITIVGDLNELKEITIYNILGQNVTSLTKQIENNGNELRIDLSQLNPGIYYVKTKNTANKVYKK